MRSSKPMAARRTLAANQAGLRTATNDALLRIAEAYFNLQAASGRLAIAREAAANADDLSRITSRLRPPGSGPGGRPSPGTRRAQAPAVGRRARQRPVARRLGQSGPPAGAQPGHGVRPGRAAGVHHPPDPRRHPARRPGDPGHAYRPELASAQQLVEAAILRVKQARLRPFVPSVSFTYAGGGFGGGAGAFFGNFGSRGDTAASLFWELRTSASLTSPSCNRRAAERNVANLEKIRTQTRVAAEVVSSFEVRLAAIRQIEEASAGLVEALDSLKLNFLNIRQGAELPRATRPIEVLQPIQGTGPGPPRLPRGGPRLQPLQFRLKRAIGQQP